MRRIGLVLLGIGLLFVVALVAVAAYRINNTRASLDNARSSLQSIENNSSELLTQQGRTHALNVLSQAATESANAVSQNNSTAVSMLAKVPFLGPQVRGINNLANDVHTLSVESIGLLNDVNSLTEASRGTTVSLPQLAALQANVQKVAASFTLMERSSGGLIDPIGSDRNQFNADLNKIVTKLNNGDQILSYMSTFLGSQGPRTYLLATENQAEMRDQGSVLSVAQIHANNGNLSLDTPVDIGAYTLKTPVDYPIPPGTQAVFGIDQPTLLWQSANVTADFPWTGGDLLAMYRQATGISDDGVVAVDVHALAGLLSISGPVHVPGIPGQVTADNAESLLLDQLYQQYPKGSQTARKDELAAVATATINKISSEHVDLAALAHVLADEVAGRHLLLYDIQPSLQTILTQYGASGAVDTTDPTHSFHLAVENATATKLDYFTATAIRQRVVVLPSGAADVFTTVTVTNHAPSGHAPSYQLGPDNFASHVSGQYIGIAYFWGPAGSVQVNSTAESGLRVSSANLNILAGHHQTVTFSTVIPRAVVNGAIQLHWIPQPTFRPQKLAITVAGQGITVGGPTIKRTKLTRSLTWTWPAG